MKYNKDGDAIAEIKDTEQVVNIWWVRNDRCWCIVGYLVPLVQSIMGYLVPRVQSIMGYLVPLVQSIMGYLVPLVQSIMGYLVPPTIAVYYGIPWTTSTKYYGIPWIRWSYSYTHHNKVNCKVSVNKYTVTITNIC